MKVKLIAFGIAKDILQKRTQEIEITDGSSIAILKSQLMEQYPSFEKLKSLKFAVDESYQEEEYILNDGAEVVIIPPVSGG